MVLRPKEDSFTRPIGEALLLTCQVTGAVDNTNYDVKWFGPNGRQIVDESGRSVAVSINSFRRFMAYWPCRALCRPSKADTH